MVCIHVSPLDTTASFHDVLKCVGVYTIGSWEGEGREGREEEVKGGAEREG